MHKNIVAHPQSFEGLAYLRAGSLSLYGLYNSGRAAVVYCL